MPTSPWFRREYDSLAVISHLTLELGNVSVFASTHPSQTTSVVLQSESAAAAEAFRVQEDGHELHVKWADGHPVDPASDYAIEIHVPRDSVAAIAFSGAGAVCVHPNALRRSVDANLTIASTGAGSLLVDDTDIRAGSLHVRQGGSGLLQLTCHDIVVAYEVDVQTTASGSTVLFASTSVSASQVTLSGSAGHTTVEVHGAVKATDFVDLRGNKYGHVQLAAHDVTTHHLALTTTGYGGVTVEGSTQVQADSVVVHVKGSGSVRVNGADGSCNTLDIDVAGNGSTSVALAATNCSVAMDGHGSVVLREGQVVTDEKISGGGQLKTFDQDARVVQFAPVELVRLGIAKGEEPED